jgi:hypothetical protein
MLISVSRISVPLALFSEYRDYLDLADDMPVELLQMICRNPVLLGSAIGNAIANTRKSLTGGSRASGRLAIEMLTATIQPA